MMLPSRLGCPLSLKTPNMGNPGLMERSYVPLVMMDRQRVQQVLGNLLDNAIRHTSEGGGGGGVST